ncbi:PREDICTED: uncharacterized protein LOC104610060 [Nelumbo nucifera]|uniref:Uncharacterized protein LOC104610060 n=1 Tax=Nelumbo nucifera TaxID=4432 RepID=A0A1U8B5T3_NELNU|nr:PREDICTED: uncharacterized protein LOC104610060 [Nelumbo nucifera]
MSTIVSAVYLHVVDVVVSKLREEFVNEGIDASVLTELQGDLKTGKKIGGGHEASGLYYLDSGGSSVVLQTSLTPLQWHCRLGHPSLKALKRLVPPLSHLSSLQCESC